MGGANIGTSEDLLTLLCRGANICFPLNGKYVNIYFWESEVGYTKLNLVLHAATHCLFSANVLIVVLNLLSWITGICSF